MFYNGNDIKGGRIISINGIEVLTTIHRDLLFNKLYEPLSLSEKERERERKSRLTILYPRRTIFPNFFLLFGEGLLGETFRREFARLEEGGDHRGLINFCPSLRSNDRGRLVASSLVWKQEEERSDA